MSRKYFGTDGIRGTANEGQLTAELALKVGMAAGQYFQRGHHKHRVVIGKDTRLSNYMIEPALTAGFTSSGMDVVWVGVMPTPAVAMLTRSLRADLGVMISASHNPFQDNGIKLFGPDGYKLSDETELELEALIDGDQSDAQRSGAGLGRLSLLEDVRGRYIEFAKNSFSKGFRLDGLKVVIDCANGAAFRVAPPVLWELGADVIELGVSPNGVNINKDCGSTKTRLMQDKVVETGADIGIALDGDADRVIIADASGTILDGDQLMAMIADHLIRRQELKGGAVVATVMSNLGLERFLKGKQVGLERTAVGDRYVVERMRETGCNIGGEQSGHIILSDLTTTGDGLIAALQVLSVMVETNRSLDQAGRMFDPIPQKLTNIRYDESKGIAPLENPGVLAAIAAGEKRLGEVGRLVIRKSGTEPLIRVMVEAEDSSMVDEIGADISEAVKRAVA